MARGADLVVNIITDASKAGAGLDEAQGKFASFKSGLSSLAGPAAAVLGGITALGVGALSSASDLQQAMGSVDAVFGDSAGEIKAWAKQASQAVGLSTSEYSQFAAVVGAQLKNLGVPLDTVNDGTNDLIKLGADLAATYGGTTTQAVEALSSALRGEADPAEKYGLSLNQTAVNAYLAEQGLSGLTGAALTSAKAQAVMALAAEQAGGAVGSFAKESDTLAGQQQRLTASWEDASASLGSALLPIITPVVEALAQFAKWVQENSAVIGPLIAAVAALAAGILVLNVVMAANPIGLIISAVAALIVGIITLWNTNEEFRNFFIGLWEGISSFFQAVWQSWVKAVESVVSWFTSAWQAVADFFTSIWDFAVAVVQAYVIALATVWRTVFNTIKTVIDNVVSFFTSAWGAAVKSVEIIIKTLQSVFTTIFNAIMVPINAVVDAFNAVVNAVKSVISWLGKIKIPDVFGTIGKLFSGTLSASVAAPAVSAYAGPSVGALSARAAVASGGGTVINVSGGLDSADTIARRIGQLLNQRAQRTGGVSIPRAAR